MNNKIFKILICCIMILLLFSNSTIIKSIANDETTIVVRNFNQFKAALENANDGDIIELDGSAIILDYDTNAIIGYSDKTITIKKKSGSTHILLTGTKNVKFQNIIFDGGNTLSYEPFIKTYGEYYPLASASFKNVVFQNINGIHDGAVFLDAGTTTFNNCTFKNNKGSYGGHIRMQGDAITNFYKCSFTEGQAYNGGAIALMSSNLSCNIISSTITNNSATEGGGIYNLGELTIENTKIHNNTTSNGGADIYNNGELNLQDSIEDLQKLFHDSELKPIAWVSDYNDDNSYLKLEFGKIEEEKNEEPNPDETNQDNETEGNQNEDNTQNTEPSNQDETNNNEPNPKDDSDEKNENNKSEQNQENISTSTSNENINNETVTNTSHNSVNDNTSSSNSNIEESSFIQKIIDKITETFNIQNPTTQQITDDSSKSITNSNESPVNQKIYITASPSNNSDYKTESSNIIPENSDSSNQTFNFSFDFKNDTYRNNDLLIILIFIQTILIVTILIILILKNKQNNKYHHYKSKKHVRKH